MAHWLNCKASPQIHNISHESQMPSCIYLLYVFEFNGNHIVSQCLKKQSNHAAHVGVPR